MPQAVLDEELAGGLNAAKKSPRNFALIVKGAAPVKLLVQKKKLRDGDVMKAKTEAKGNDVIIGVLEASGTDFAFKVLGNAEPSVATAKLKELISAQADITAKPRWVLVNELPDIGDEDDNQQTSPQPPVTQQPSGQAPPAPPLQAPPPPPPPQLDAKQLLAAMNKLSPQIQAAAQANPNRKAELTQPVAAFQQHIQASDLEAAKADLSQIVALLKTMPAAQQQSAPTGGAAKFSIVKLGKARVEWIAVRDAALAGIGQLRQAIEAEFADDEEQTQELRQALATLDQKIRTLEVHLHEELDKILNAEEQARPALVANSKKTVAQLTTFLDNDPIMGEIDDNEVVPGMRIVKPVRDKLTEIAAALG